MISIENFRKNLGKRVILGRNIRNADRLETTTLYFFSGVINEIFEYSVSASHDNDYGIKFTDARLSGKGGTTCVTEHKTLYEIPLNVLTGEMKSNELRGYVKKSPDYNTQWGNRDDHIEDIVNNLDTIVENYQIG